MHLHLLGRALSDIVSLDWFLLLCSILAPGDNRRPRNRRRLEIRRCVVRARFLWMRLSRRRCRHVVAARYVWRATA